MLNFKIFFNHKVWLLQNTVILSHSRGLQRVKSQQILQPWKRYDYDWIKWNQAILERYRKWNFKILFNHGEGMSMDEYDRIQWNQAIIDPYRSWNLKIFFNHGECIQLGSTTGSTDVMRSHFFLWEQFLDIGVNRKATKRREQNMNMDSILVNDRMME